MEKFKLPESKHYSNIISKVEEVAKAKENSEVVLESLVAAEQEKTIAKCKTIGINAHTLITDLRKKHSGINRPDSVFHIPNGKETTKQEAYTEKRFQELEKLTADIKALQEAFDKAMTSSLVSDFVELEKLVNKLNPAQKQQ